MQRNNAADLICTVIEGLKAHIESDTLNIHDDPDAIERVNLALASLFASAAKHLTQPRSKEIKCDEKSSQPGVDAGILGLKYDLWRLHLRYLALLSPLDKMYSTRTVAAIRADPMTYRDALAHYLDTNNPPAGIYYPAWTCGTFKGAKLLLAEWGTSEIKLRKFMSVLGGL